MMRDDAWKTYESWRRLWLSGGDSNAIAVLRFHGLRGRPGHGPGAACSRSRPRPPPSVNVDLPIADAVIVEAGQPGPAPAARVVASRGRRRRAEIRGEPSCLKRKRARSRRIIWSARPASTCDSPRFARSCRTPRARGASTG